MCYSWMKMYPEGFQEVTWYQEENNHFIYDKNGKTQWNWVIWDATILLVSPQVYGEKDLLECG